jgi:hypothetical protein
MSTARILDFRLSWHPQSGGIVEYHLQGSDQLFTVRLKTPEFAAAAAVLANGPVFVSNGWLHTGAELPQDLQRSDRDDLTEFRTDNA